MKFELSDAANGQGTQCLRHALSYPDPCSADFAILGSNEHTRKMSTARNCSVLRMGIGRGSAGEDPRPNQGDKNWKTVSKLLS